MAKFALWRRRISLESGSSRPLPYPASRVETRAAGTLTASIPYDSPLACECYGRGSVRRGGKRDDLLQLNLRKGHLSYRTIS